MFCIKFNPKSRHPSTVSSIAYKYSPQLYFSLSRIPNKVSVVLFSADWADQCAQVLEVLQVLANKPAMAKFYQFLDVAAEELSEISLQQSIEAVPTVLFLRDGKAIDRINGVNIAALAKKCETLAGLDSAEPDTSLNDRLKKLTHSAPVMVFMKGNPATPRCGFSKQLMGILNETEVAFETFDILLDEEVRQGLKTYSDWPTYPQVYVKGELIGGLDIIKELKESESLVSTLKGE